MTKEYCRDGCVGLEFCGGSLEDGSPCPKHPDSIKEELLTALEARDLKIVIEFGSVEEAVEYIGWDKDYTVEDWIHDTLENYPEVLERR